MLCNTSPSDFLMSAVSPGHHRCFLPNQCKCPNVRILQSSRVSSLPWNTSKGEQKNADINISSSTCSFAALAALAALSWWTQEIINVWEMASLIDSEAGSRKSS